MLTYGSPLAVIDPVGMTVAAVVVEPWQHKSLVFNMFVNGAVGTEKLLV